MERQIEQNLSNEENQNFSVKQEVKQMVDDSSQTHVEPQVIMRVNFFKGHLDYNVNDLMNDL
jgi:hypothetical protein